LFRASKDRTSVTVDGIIVQLEDGVGRVDLSVKPVLRDGDPAAGFFLITFEEAAIADTGERVVTLTSPAEPPAQHLEEELARLKAQLQATIEQYETQVEEAKASNEE